MKKKLLQISMMLGLSAAMLTNANAQVGIVPGCPGAFGPTKIITGTNKTQTTGSKMLANVTFHKDTIYILKDFVRVATGVTLTIEAGTIVMGMPAPADTSCLIIEQGGKLIANGTAALPIVFTSCKLQGTRNRGDWGGPVLCGKATNNLGTNVVLEGNYGAIHGGTDDNDNSGSLKFVRIEYAGLAFEPNKEINGLTFASVGRGTTIQNIQVSHANDDSYEWFGGSVSTRNLIAWKGIDDDFDTDNGYHGFNQFGLGFRDPDVADFSGSKGFESDNNDPSADATFTILPKTTAIFSNYEVWGPIQTSSTPFNAYYKNGAHLRRGSEQKIYNTLFIGWPADSLQSQASGVFVDGPQSTHFAVVDSLRLRNSISAAYPPSRRILTNQPYASWAPYSTPDAWFNTAGYHNTTKGNVLLDQKKAPFKAIPLFTTSSTSVLIATGSSFSNVGDAHMLPVGAYPNGFQSVAFRGAFGGTDWTAGWTEFHPNLFVYTAGLPTRLAVASAFFASNKVDASAQISCFPNPTSSSTTITFNLDNASEGVVSVMDASGSVVYSTIGNFISGSNSVDYAAAGLTPGMYYVQVITNSGTTKAGKLVIQ